MSQVPAQAIWQKKGHPTAGGLFKFGWKLAAYGRAAR
jgi:hypothetical protein